MEAECRSFVNPSIITHFYSANGEPANENFTLTIMFHACLINVTPLVVPVISGDISVVPSENVQTIDLSQQIFVGRNALQSI